MRDWTTLDWGMLLVPAEEAAEAALVLDDFLATAKPARRPRATSTSTSTSTSTRAPTSLAFRVDPP